jgi:hypothetical protein
VSGGSSLAGFGAEGVGRSMLGFRVPESLLMERWMCTALGFRLLPQGPV